MATTDSSIDCRRHSPCDLRVGLPIQGAGTQLVSLLKDVLRAADGGVWRIADMARHLFHSVFYYPALGTTLLCLWLGLMMWLFKHAFRIADRYSALLLVPLALVVITDVDLGYWIYYLKLRGHFFIAPMGFSWAFAMVWAYRVLPTNGGCAQYGCLFR